MSQILPRLALSAEGITVHAPDNACVVVVTLFRPTQLTVERLKRAQHGERYEAVELRDKSDNGEWNIYESLRPHTFLEVRPESRHKTKIQHVTFYRY